MSTTMGSGAFEVQSAAARTNSTRSKENRRISVAPTPQGIDDYARIIVQSRNAKMQKWRTMGKQQSPYNTVQRSTLGDMRGSLRESSSRVLLQPWDPSGVPLDRTASADYLPSEIATPNVSPAGSQSALQEEEDLHQLTETAGRREIEWVDWLDEYRKMKEAKLRSEKEEIETQRREEEEAEVSLELEVLPISQSATPTTATSHDFPAMPTMSRSTEPSMASLSQSLSSSMGIPDSKRGSRPRRPSEMPRFTARQDSSIRRSSSNAYFSSGSKDSGSYEGSTSPVDRRASIFGDKNRTLSLSPINSRLGTSSSQLGGFGANAVAASSSSKRKKMLGGKIEAWWGAVKSGFGGTPSSLMGISSMQPPVPSPHSGFSSYSSKSIPSNRTKESRQPREGPASSNDLYSIFGSQSYGLPHNRSNTLQVPAHDSAETQSVHMLRAASSVQNMRSGEGEGDEMASSEGLADSVSEEASKRSNRSSTGTAHAVPHLTPAQDENVEESLTGSPDDDKDRSVAEESATQKRSTSKGSHLSLHLRHGQSAFDAAPFEKLSSSQSGVSSAPADGTATRAPAEEVPETTLSSAPAAAPSNKEEKTLSDAWKPEVEDESKPQLRSSHRGRSSQRHGQAGNAEARASSKDFTINSIRQHIHNRLTSSKEAFDRELKKIIHSINAYVEDALQEQLLDEGPERESEQSGEPEEEGTIETMPDRDTSLEASLGLLTLGESMPAVAAPGDISGDSVDADRTAQPESEGHTEAPTPRPSRDTEESTGPKSSTAQQDYTLPSPPHARKPSMAALLPGRSVSRSTTLSRQSRHGDTLSTSRSTSRSHSPMPGATLHGVQATESPQYSPARRLRQLDAEEAPVEPFVTALQDLVAIAMDVYDTSIYTLTSTSGACSDIISQVQAVGRRWDENPQWDGRGWYVQLLLAVAGLSRVVEWWEAEKGFWNFQDETEQGNKGDAEPIRFIVGNAAAAAVEGQEYGDFSLSSARSAVSTSPSRIRQLNPQQILSLTPSQHSSAHSSPALEPWDRRVVSEGDRGRMSLGKATTDAAEDGSSKTEEANATSAPVERGPDKRESQNVVMELSLVGERFLYVSPAWRKVIGSDPGDVLDVPIEEVLAPGDASTFAQATQQLQANDAHTVEVAFRLQVRSAHLEEAGTTYYQEMEGKGMLMHDRQSAMPSHTMWVFKPVGSPEAETDLAPGPQKPAAGAGEPPVVTEAAGASAATQILISTEPLLCRICERDVPTWFFEKHSEICNEIHRLEMEISEYNEGLAELRRTARTIVQAIDDMERTEGIEYRNLLLSTPAATTGPPSALEVANRSITPRHLNPAAIRKTHLRALDSILAILRTAASISTPAVKDDTASDPIEKQRLLSPDSEDRIVQVKNWKRVSCEDAALDMLATDVETAMRSKLSAVNRMLNTIVYVETVRMEWEGRVEAALGQVREESDSDDSAGSAIEEQEASTLR